MFRNNKVMSQKVANDFPELETDDIQSLRKVLEMKEQDTFAE